MTSLTLVTSHLASALAQLQTHLDLPRSAIGKQHPELINTFHTAAIKSFEYAYELSIRLMRRALVEMTGTPESIEQLEFKTMVRTAAQRGLIDDPQSWFLFREKRNITSHTYDVVQALGVLAVMPLFIEKATFLLHRLSAHAHS